MSQYTIHPLTVWNSKLQSTNYLPLKTSSTEYILRFPEQLIAITNRIPNDVYILTIIIRIITLNVFSVHVCRQMTYRLRNTLSGYQLEGQCFSMGIGNTWMGYGKNMYIFQKKKSQFRRSSLCRRPSRGIFPWKRLHCSVDLVEINSVQRTLWIFSWIKLFLESLKILLPTEDIIFVG